MPAAVQPFKRNGPCASDAARLDMLRLAIARDPRLAISTLEIERGGTSYLFDTLNELRQTLPRAELFFIIGMDSLRGLHKWYRAPELLALATFLTAARPGFVPPPPDSLGFPEPWPRRLLDNIIPCPSRDIASSDIREKVAQKLPIRYLVPRGVAAYIRANALYTSKETP